MSLNLSRFVIIRAQLFNLRFYPHVLSAALFCNSRYFAQEESIFKKLLRAGDTFVDIGAQIGAMSLTASHFVGPTGHVFAIEADRRILRYLRGNISLNRASNVIPLRADGDTLEEYRERTERTWPVHKATPQPGVDENAPEKNYILLNGPVRVLRLDQDAPEPFVAHFAGTFLSRAEYVYIDNSRSSPKQHEPISTSLLTWLRTEGFQLLAPDVAASPGRAFLLARRSSVNSDIVDTGGPALASVT